MKSITKKLEDHLHQIFFCNFNVSSNSGGTHYDIDWMFHGILVLSDVSLPTYFLTND